LEFICEDINALKTVLKILSFLFRNTWRAPL